MIDPVSTAAAQLAARATGALVLGFVQDWIRGDEFDRLLKQVAERLGPDVGAVALAPLREDETVVVLVAAFLDDPEAWNEEELVNAIEPHVGALEDAASPRETAEVIARLMRENAWRAFKDDREAIIHELRAGRLSGTASVVVLTYDWVPRQALARVHELRGSNPTEAHKLEQELVDEARRARTVEILIRKPKDWVRQGSGSLWIALGDLASAYGKYEAAEQAFLAAANRPGTDRVRLLTRAAQVAYARAEDARGEELLAEARTLDADHPSVAIVEALVLTEPQSQLERLRNLEPLDDLQAAAIESTRSLAHLALGDVAAAKRARDRAVARAGSAPILAELGPAIAFVENTQRTRDESVDVVALAEAAGEYLKLRTEAAAHGRNEEALHFGARAAEIYSMVGDYRGAGSLLDELAAETESLSPGPNDAARRHLASAAIEGGRPELVAQFLNGVTPTDVDRLMLAQSRSVIARDPAGAIPELDSLLDSPDELVKWQSAQLRLAAAADGLGWNERAYSIVRETDESLAEIMRASHLNQQGDTEQAERLLHARISDSRALELLIDITAAREEWETALQLHHQLTETGNTPERRYIRARLLESAGSVDGALGQLEAIGADVTAPVSIRTRSYSRSAQVLYRAGRYSELTNVARAWHELEPLDPEPAWLVVLGLARLGRWDEALLALDRRDIDDQHGSGPLEPLDVHNAELAATVIFHALAPSDAIPRIASISDRFDRSIERLEALLIFAGLTAHDLPEKIGERVRQSVQEFENRFPGSHMIRAVEAPTDGEGLTQFVREHIAADAPEAEAIYRAVYRGEAATAHLAAFLHKHVPEVWAGSGFLPIGYGDPTLDELERADAQAAVLRPAVWDAAALYVVGGLGNSIADAIVNALPGSVLPQSTLDDVIGWGDGPTPNPDGEQTILGWDAETQRPRIVIIPADEIERQRASARGIRELARRLLPVANRDSTNPGRFAELLEFDHADEASPAFMSWPATFAVAARRGQPIFSDDRYIRLEARRAGIPTFGTVALLNVLVGRDMLEAAAASLSMQRLRASGAFGLVPNDSDLIAEVAAADWGITELVARALHDPTGWREITTGLRRLATLLRAVFRSSKDDFGIWVERALDATCAAYPEITSDRLAGALLSLSWLTDDASFARAMTSAVRTVRRWRGYRDDPAQFATRLLMNTLARKQGPVRLAVAKAVLRATPIQEHPDLLGLVGPPAAESVADALRLNTLERRPDTSSHVH